MDFQTRNLILEPATQLCNFLLNNGLRSKQSSVIRRQNEQRSSRLNRFRIKSPQCQQVHRCQLQAALTLLILHLHLQSFSSDDHHRAWNSSHFKVSKFSNHIFYNFNILPPCPALSTFNCVRFYFAMFIIFICTCTPSFLNRTYFEKQLQKTRFIYWEEGFVQSSVKVKMWDSGSTSIFNSFITEPSN